MSSGHSPTLPSLYLRHSSFSNPSVASPTSQLILQPFFRFSYITGSWLASRPCFAWSLRIACALRHWVTCIFSLEFSPLDPRFAGSNPAGVGGFFQSVKILSMTSFGRDVKPLVPYRRVTVRKRNKPKLEPLSKICQPFHAHCRKWRWSPEKLESVVKPNNNNNLWDLNHILILARKQLLADSFTILPLDGSLWIFSSESIHGPCFSRRPEHRLYKWARDHRQHNK